MGFLDGLEGELSGKVARARRHIPPITDENFKEEWAKFEMDLNASEDEDIAKAEAKAKAMRPVAEKIITKAKKGGVHNHRNVVKFLRDREMASKLFDEIGPRYEDRPGGYIRIIKLDPRSGDNAPMARVELV